MIEITKTNDFSNVNNISGKFVVVVTCIILLFALFIYFIGRIETKEVYIEDIFINQKHFTEGHSFRVLFTVVNEYSVPRTIQYQFHYNSECLEINSSSGDLRLISGHQTFYSEFYIKENLTKDCYKYVQGTSLVLKSSEVLDTKTIYFDYAIPVHRIDELKDII